MLKHVFKTSGISLYKYLVAIQNISSFNSFNGIITLIINGICTQFAYIPGIHDALVLDLAITEVHSNCVL